MYIMVLYIYRKDITRMNRLSLLSEGRVMDMTIGYKGASEETNENRLAEIFFEEEEQRILERMIKVLAIKGWMVDLVTDGYAQMTVDNKSEFDDFKCDYLEIKRAVKLWEKFGM